MKTLISIHFRPSEDKQKGAYRTLSTNYIVDTQSGYSNENLQMAFT